MTKIPKKATQTSAAVVLAEIDRVFEEGEFYQSRESGKRFYEAEHFPELLMRYIIDSGAKAGVHAKKFGMATSTLEMILQGGRLSDNMLMRIRSSLSREVSKITKTALFPGDWHDARPAHVSQAIADVSSKLVFLKRVIESSNFLNSAESPIDRIQVVQLVALLTATLEALRAPFVDKQQAGGFFRWLANFSKKSAEKGLEKVVVDAMAEAVNAGKKLIDKLSDIGWPDLGGPG